MSRQANGIYCNCCGRKICGAENRDHADFLLIQKEWGYFSKDKDGEIHNMDICEPCYDKLVKSFAIPPETNQTTELV